MVIKDKLTLKGDRELFMSFGLLNELTGIVQDPSRIGAMDLDQEMREQIVDALFAERSKSGRRVNKAEEVELPELPYEDYEAAFDWAKGHVMGFFIRRLENTAKVVDQTKGRLEKVESSLVGSSSEASKTS